MILADPGDRPTYTEILPGSEIRGDFLQFDYAIRILVHRTNRVHWLFNEKAVRAVLRNQ